MNIGYGLCDTFEATENMFFYDRIANKLDKVTFNIPLKNNSTLNNKKNISKLHQQHNFLEPWTFTSNDGRLEMDFIPILYRNACTDFKILISDQHQVFGDYSGKVLLNDSTEIKFNNLLGFAEKVHNKW